MLQITCSYIEGLVILKVFIFKNVRPCILVGKY
jgi:hypothetical protein